MSDTSVVFNLLAKDNVSSVLKRITMNAAGMAAGFLGAQGISATFGKAMSFVKDSVIGFNQQLDNASIAFTTMLGSGEQAKSFLDQLKKFAVATPFEFSDLVTASQRMIAMGISAKDVIPTLTGVGDAVAALGTGKEGIDRITLALGQMNTKQKISAEEMLQLTEAGIPAYQILADKMHMTVGALQAMMASKGGGNAVFQAVGGIQAIVDGLESGTAHARGFAGMMDKTSHTLTGSLSNIKDILNQSISTAMRPFFDLATSGAQKLAGFLTGGAFSSVSTKVSAGLKNATETAKGFIKNADFSQIVAALSKVKDFVINDIVPSVKNLAEAFGPTLKEMFNGVKEALGPVSSMLGPIGTTLKDVTGFIADHKTVFMTVAVGILAVVGALKAYETYQLIVATATKIWAAAQAALNVVMATNPIVLIILAVVALAAAFIYAYTHSEKFRNIVQSVLHAIADAALWLWHNVLDPLFQFWRSGFELVSRILFSFGAIWWAIWSNTIGAALLWVWHKVVEPFWGGLKLEFQIGGAVLKAVLDKVSSVVHSVGSTFSSVFRAIGGYVSGGFKSAAGIVKGAVNEIIGLVNKAIGGINGLVDKANKIPGVDLPHLPAIPKLATGGYVRSGGVAVVGENGPELVTLPGGSRVYPNGTGPGGGGTGLYVVNGADSKVGQVIDYLIRAGFVTNVARA